MNKNISIWRGPNTPPTLNHLWIDEANNIKINVNNAIGKNKSTKVHVPNAFIVPYNLAKIGNLNILKFITALVISLNKLILNPPSPQEINANTKRTNNNVNPATNGHVLWESPFFSGIKSSSEPETDSLTTIIFF